MFNDLKERIRERYFDFGFTKDQERAVLIVFAAFLAVGGIFFLLAQGSASSAASTKPLPAITFPATPTVSPIIVVDVSGKVVKPGVYKLPVGSRAIDALDAAGGAKSGVDVSDINLAHVLTDGEQIIVGAPKIVVASGKSKGKSKVANPTSTSPINVNTATSAQLDSLPGIGPVMAARIIAYRQKSGLFKVLTDLRKVPGMGASKFAEIQNLIRL
ncbi:MAG: ComEA family DNA-binding protein [Actinobacteria bacterium]|nr:ComEA family DNA-binding protein [Actinomycetota bacterium]